MNGLNRSECATRRWNVLRAAAFLQDPKRSCLLIAHPSLVPLRWNQGASVGCRRGSGRRTASDSGAEAKRTGVCTPLCSCSVRCHGHSASGRRQVRAHASKGQRRSHRGRTSDGTQLRPRPLPRQLQPADARRRQRRRTPKTRPPACPPRRRVAPCHLLWWGKPGSPVRRLAGPPFPVDRRPALALTHYC